MTNRRPRPEREEQWRLFVAIDLPASWQEAFRALMEHMQRALDAAPETRGVRPRWVRPEGIHLTLKFLGETPVERLDAVRLSLAQAVQPLPGLELAIGSVGTFRDRRSPRVIWVGVAGDTDALAQCAERIDIRLGTAGFPREQRPFTPHLTLARLPDTLSPPQREAVIQVAENAAVPEVPAIHVGHVSLIRSHLGPGGARYETVASFPETARPIEFMSS